MVEHVDIEDAAFLLFAVGIIGTGLLAVLVMFAMMLMTRNPKVMGSLSERGHWLYRVGWLATALMAVAAIAMFATLGK